jgi:hypothetical protein
MYFANTITLTSIRANILISLSPIFIMYTLSTMRKKYFLSSSIYLITILFANTVSLLY